jgi:hypothetical protein
MDTGGILATISLVVSVGGAILAIINHKRIRSKCCGKNMDMSIDIEDTTPTKPKDIAITVAPPPPIKQPSLPNEVNEG